MATTTSRILKLSLKTTAGSQTISFKNPVASISGAQLASFNSDNAPTGVSIESAQFVTTQTDDKIVPAAE